MKKKFLLILLSIILYTHARASVTAITGVAMSPGAPNPGQTVNLSWNFTSSYGPEPEKYFIAIYNSCPITSGFGASTNMHVMVGDACAQPTPNYGNGCLSCVANSGCDEIPQPPSAGTYSFSKAFAIPTTLIPGQTYYAVVAMGSYNVYLQGNGITAEQQACVPFTVPLTPPYIHLRKTSEGTTGSVGTKVLFTIYYDAGNVHNFRITDAVDSRFTILNVFNGGTAVGQNITWVVNSGYITSPAQGSVSFLAQINSGSAGTVIPNTAVGVANEIAGSNSNIANVVIGQPGLSVSKSVSALNLNPGDIITYTMQYVNQGTTLVEFENFDSGTIPAGWTNAPAGGTWNAAPGYLQQTALGSGYTGYLDNNIAPLHDGIYVCDMLIPSSNTAHWDGVMHFIQVDSNNFYMARINASDKRLYLDKVVAGVATIGGTSVAMPHGLNIEQDKWYTLKVQVCGSNISMKVWPRGDNEYPAWDLNVTDASIPGNGIVGFQANEGPQQYDNLKVFSLTASTNPRLFDTVPAAITYQGCGGGTSCSKPGSVVNWAVGSTCGGVQAVSWWGQVTGACGQTITNTAGIDSDDSPPPSFSNSVYTGIFCVPTPTRSSTRTPTIGPTNSVSPTNTPSRTNTPTFTRTLTMTVSATPTYSWTMTRTPTMTNTQAITPTFTHTPSRSATGTYTRTITHTFTRTNTASPTSTGTAVNTPTFTRTITPSPTATFTGSATFTRTMTATNTGSPTFTNTGTPTFSRTATPTMASTLTNTPTFTRTVSPTFSRTVTATPTYTVTPTVTITSMNTPTVTPTITATYTASPTGTPTFTRTASPTFSRTVTATPTYTATPTVTITSMNTPTVTPTITTTYTASPTGTPTFTRTASPTFSRTVTATPTFTVTLTVTITSINTPTVTPTITATYTASPTGTGTYTQTPTFTYTVSRTPSPTFTMTLTVTITSIDTATVTPTITQTHTASPTFTDTVTLSATATYTVTPTVTITSMDTATVTPTVTPSFTATFTDTGTMTYTATPTVTITSIDTATVTGTVTRTNTDTPTFTATFTPTYTGTFTHSRTASPTFTGTASSTMTLTMTLTSTCTYTATVTRTPGGNPVDLLITIKASGDEPDVGAVVKYSITIRNPSPADVYNLFIWDSLPSNLTYLSSLGPVTPVINNNVLYWDMTGLTLAANSTLNIDFWVRINAIIPLDLIETAALADYNDPFYVPALGRHPPVMSAVHYYPEDLPVVFPNPFNPDKAVNNKLKFLNVIPGSTIIITTLSGEYVTAKSASMIREEWDGKNSGNKPVSPGIYYYIIKNPANGVVHVGKIFVVRE